jgi:hypothetical protein
MRELPAEASQTPASGANAGAWASKRGGPELGSPPFGMGGYAVAIVAQPWWESTFTLLWSYGAMECSAELGLSGLPTSPLLPFAIGELKVADAIYHIPAECLQVL